MNKYENVMVNMMIKMHFSLPITTQWSVHASRALMRPMRRNWHPTSACGVSTNTRRLRGKPEGKRGWNREQQHLGSSLLEGVDKRCLNDLMAPLSRLSLPRRRPGKTQGLKLQYLRSFLPVLRSRGRKRRRKTKPPSFALVDCAAEVPRFEKKGSLLMIPLQP